MSGKITKQDIYKYLISVFEKDKNLNKYEKMLIQDKVNELNINIVDKTTISYIVELIRSELEDKDKMIAYKKMQGSIDIHNQLKKELSDDNAIPVKKINNAHRVVSDIDTIFGTRDSVKLRKLLNPGSFIRKAYIILDRRYQTRINDDNSRFKWNLSYHGGVDIDNTIVTRAALKNIVGMKMYPFRFPNTDNTITFPMRLSVNVEEIGSQSFIMPGSNRRCQFLFSVTREGNVGSMEPYQLNDVGENMTEFRFYTAIKYLESITLTFGNPFLKLTLDPDILPATISAAGVQTLLTFSQPHFALDGELIYIEGFLTDNTSADYVEIELMNNKFGWEIASSTSTTLTIDVDISSLTGSIINNPYNIYLDGKRFAIPIELYYLSDK